MSRSGTQPTSDTSPPDVDLEVQTGHRDATGIGQLMTQSGHQPAEQQAQNGEPAIAGSPFRISWPNYKAPGTGGIG
jgi:hypothetical protein